MAKVFSPFTAIRVPPQNIEAEIALLGSLLLDGVMIDRVADVLGPQDFYKKEHQSIFESMLHLFSHGRAIDVITVSDQLKEKGILDEAGGFTYLTTLSNSVPTASSATYYAEIVRKKKILRDLISASQDISQLGYEGEDNVDQLLDEAERRIFAIAHSSLIKGFSPVSETLEEAWERIDRLHKGGGALRGVPTGFKALDNKLSGFQRSDFIVLASRPSLGKTSLAMDIARHVALNEGLPVGIFSLEMSKAQLVDRLIAAEANVGLWELRTGRLSSEEDFESIRDSLEKLSKASLFIDDEVSTNILQMRAKARRLQAEKGLGLIIVDYLQLMVPRIQSDSLVQQITEISRSLKALARELDVPVLALSQLNRAVEARPNKRPQLSDLRESGAIEQDADVVMFIYREDKVKERSDRQNQADIIIAKHRNGPTGEVTLYFNQDRASFTSIEKNFE